MSDRFDVKVLLDRARERTGLEDFGDPSFREGLERLAEALDGEARLHEMGRAAWQMRISGYLEERLRVEDWHRRHRAIGEERIVAPVIVTGLPRTGTTALSNLLAQDPAARSLRVWESAHPTPPPEAATQDTDSRIALAERGLEAMKAMAPEMAAMHEDTATSTAENIDLLGMAFRTQHFDGMAPIPSYTKWWQTCDMEPAYRFHARVLQLLQWRCPPTRWNLKNPPDVFCLEALDRVYPDARFVWTHRDPAQAMASLCSLIATVRATSSAPVERTRLGPEHLAQWTEGMRRAMAFRERADPARFVDVYMDDLVAHPVETVAMIHAALGLPFPDESERRVRAWSEANPQGKHGAHRYTLESFGLRPEGVRDAFRPYMERFGIV